MAILELEEDTQPEKKTSAKPAKAEEPGWFQPGSRSEALTRGFAQGATLGMAPKFSAYGQRVLSNLMPDTFGTEQTQPELLKQYLAANRQAAEAQPGYSAVGNIVGAAPSMIAAGVGSIPAQIAKGAGLSALDTLGSSQKSGMDLAQEVGKGALVGGATSSVLPVAGKIAQGAKSIVKGTTNPKALAEAAINFKNAPVPPTVGQVTPGSAKRAWADLQSTLAPDVAESVIRQSPESLSKATKEAIVASHNINAPGIRDIAKDMATTAAIGAGTTAVPTYLATSGDIDKTLTAAGTGAMAGAAYGGRQALSNPAARIRLPAEASPLDFIGNAVETGVRPLVTMATQSAAKDIKEAGGISTNPFGKLSSYIRQSQGATNPEVEALAARADELYDLDDPESKRRAAMALQNTPEGRAVGNSLSNVRDLD